MTDSPESIGRLIYLLILLVGIGAALLFGRRLEPLRAMRDLAIWGLILAMVVIVYGFRDVLTREMMPDRAMVTESGAIAVRRGSGGHFRTTIDVNGAPVRFLIDTGATGIVLAQSDARAAGIDPDVLAFDDTAITANGRVAIAPVRLDRMSFGGMEFRDIPAQVNGGVLDVSLLGMSFLNRFDRIEIRGDTLILHGPVTAQRTR